MDFVDTSAWYAYFLPNDSAHQKVRTYFYSTNRTLATTDYCVDETLTLLVARNELRRALDAGRAFFEASIAQIQFVTPDQINRAWILFQQRAINGWSFTDCTSKIVIDDLGIKAAVTLDTHFHQFAIRVFP